MHEVKKCVQCNELKDVTEFREYTHSRKNADKTEAARYRICKSCENINSRYNKAKAVLVTGLSGDYKEEERWWKANSEVNKIDMLYDALELRGLRTPRTGKVDKTTSIDEVDRLLDKIAQEEKVLPTVKEVAIVDVANIPTELQFWLGDVWKAENQSPEFFQETIYESLKAKYRPQIGVDKEKGIIIHDDTYKQVLNDILRNFDDYEDNYVETEETE